MTMYLTHRAYIKMCNANAILDHGAMLAKVL